MHATQLSAAAIFEGEHGHGSYTGRGLSIKYAAKSEISKTYSGCACPCFEEVLVKDINLVLLIRSRRDVNNYLVFTHFAS